MIVQQILTVATKKIQHPFQGGVKAKSITKKHKPLIWEGMLGTVHSRSPEGETKYHHYDWDEAHEHAQVHNHKDLRIARSPHEYSWEGINPTGPRKGKHALWGIHKDDK